MHDRFSRRLIEHLRHEGYEPVGLATLMNDLGIDEADKADFERTLAELAEAGRLELDAKGVVRLPRVGEVVEGIFRKNPKGFGFVVPLVKVREGDVFVPAEATADALSGDTVKVRVGRRRRPGGGGGGEEELFGSVIEVVARKRKVFTGELGKQGAQWLAYPDGRELTDPIVIRDPHAKNAKLGDKVVVEITHYPEGTLLAEGVIVDVLGAAGEPSVETAATIAAYNLPGEFDERVVAQARRCTEQFDREVAQFDYDYGAATREREDLRKEFIVTIDPPDAKDYDDAIHIKRLPGNAGWELGVHIADVAHFIPMGTPLDVEARARGNSVYLPRHVIPMLPEVLSNGICSLQEGVPRFCKSATMHYDRSGAILRAGVSSTLIKSVKRMTYLEAQALIDGDLTEAKKHAKTEPNYTDELLACVREMDACARAIRQRRREAGMIHLDLPQVELIFDESGRVVDAQREDDAFTHTIIEMFMVEANEVLARVFERVRVPLLRRVHPEPTPGDVDDLRAVAKVAGFVIPKKPTRKELQQLLDGTRGTPAAPAVHFAVLRTLTKAEYSPALIGHYALASSAYAHFTSPIRRYPDLTVHRSLAEYLRRTENGSKPPRTEEEERRLGEKLRESKNCPDADELMAVGRHCSTTEVNAAEAESHLRSFLVLQLLSEHVGEEFRGMVTGCKNVGLFIQLEKYLAEGMIKREDLPLFPDRNGRMGGSWRLDPRSGAMTHAGSGRTFNVGDQVTVRIAKVDLALRRMELVIPNAESRTKSKVGKAPAELRPGLGAGQGGSGGLNLDWDQIKYGKSGAARRSQKSKARDRGKGNHRRDA
jgi:ribonuclease R